MRNQLIPFFTLDSFKRKKQNSRSKIPFERNKYRYEIHDIGLSDSAQCIDKRTAKGESSKKPCKQLLVKMDSYYHYPWQFRPTTKICGTSKSIEAEPRCSSNENGRLAMVLAVCKIRGSRIRSTRDHTPRVYAFFHLVSSPSALSRSTFYLFTFSSGAVFCAPATFFLVFFFFFTFPFCINCSFRF